MDVWSKNLLYSTLYSTVIQYSKPAVPVFFSFYRVFLLHGKTTTDNGAVGVSADSNKLQCWLFYIIHTILHTLQQ